MYDLSITENRIDYGILKGEDRLLYVKVGNGGDIYGRENKYLRIARQIRAHHGWSVLVASTPADLSAKDCMAYDTAFIQRRFENAADIYAFGNSKGGQMLLSYAYLNPRIKRVAAVNAPLMIDLHKTKAGLQRFEGDRITLIYGEKDQSAGYLPFLKHGLPPKCHLITVAMADHNFSEMTEEFIGLPERYLFQ